jgi:hypothetical protein
MRRRRNSNVSEEGSLFRRFLLGQDVAPSWDTRKEVEYGAAYTDGRGAPIINGRPRERSSPRESVLLRYIRLTVATEDVEGALAAYAEQHSIPLDLRPGDDPCAKLEELVLSRATPQQREAVLARLQGFVHAQRSARKRKKPRRRKPLHYLADRDRRQLRRKRGRSGSKRIVAKGGKAATAASRTCSLCGAQLTPREVDACSRARSVFLGQMYCTSHAEQVRALFQPHGRGSR